MAHLGLDLSNWNGPITPAQAQQLHAEGIEFVYLLATDGNTFRNSFGPQQAEALRGAGILVGWYHFYRPSITNSDQILNFIAMVTACHGTPLPLALDSETPDATGWQDLANRMVDFARQIEAQHVGIPNPRSLLYVNDSFATSLSGFPWGRWVWLADPSNTRPGLQRLITQSAPRPVAGLSGLTDPDTFVGSEADWAVFTGGVAPIPAPVPTTTVTEEPVPARITTTLTPGLDTNGNGYYVLPNVPDATKIENVVFIGEDPRTGLAYTPESAFPKWYPAGNALVIVGGIPGGQYAVEIWVAS